MPLTFVLDPEPTPALRNGICELWADVVNAGGAVGFVPPITPEDVRPELIKHLAELAEDRSRLLVGYDGPPTSGVSAEPGAPDVGGHRRVAATAFLGFNAHRLMQHWCWLFTVMLHPRLQGRGEGRRLLGAAEEAARGMAGIRGIRLTCRGGLGLEHFYASCGYQEVGRVPDAIRAADDDFRDDVTMWLPLK